MKVLIKSIILFLIQFVESIEHRDIQFLPADTLDDKIVDTLKLNGLEVLHLDLKQLV